MTFLKIIPFHKRKQNYILKISIFILSFVFTVSFFSNYFGIPIYPSFISSLHHLGPVQDLKTLRKQVLEENTDEFLEAVLQEVDFREVNLEKCRGRKSEHARFDKEILDDEGKIIPHLGAGGRAATVRTWQRKEEERVMKKEGFNRLLSEMISLNRTGPDTREISCRLAIYDTSSLPTMSIVIVFTNEAFVSIVRMIFGLINRTPAHLLKEIILVDDYSNRVDLKGKLERFLATRFPVNTIRLLRLSMRSGLIRSRMIGAHVAVGDVLIFLDAHCEIIDEWSEPLLQRIKEKRTTVVVPVIDVINEKTMEYSMTGGDYFFLGGFKWSGLFYWIKIPKYIEDTKRHHYDPTRSPTMPGGLFGIDRKYFWEIGSYDPGMKVWGAENLEMSFRIWQCGGSVETVPCSRVGHIFRTSRPYTFTAKDNTRNVLRMAAVWMDDYKELVFHQQATLYDFGDVTSRREFRKRKKCKSFQWYLDNVYKEKFRLQRDSTRWGQLKNTISNYCLDDMGNKGESFELQVYPCHPKLYLSQSFYLSKKYELRNENVCATVDGTKKVQMKACDYVEDKRFRWEYVTGSHGGKLVNRVTKKCLTVKNKPGLIHDVTMENCGSSGQNWVFINHKDKKVSI